MNTTCKPSNPKDICGSSKLPLSLWPTTATALGSIALLNGALKYGRSNFRAVGVRSSIYYDAARRHLDAWFEGEECDSDDGVPHLAAVLACIAIIVDAGAAGKLTDDRMISGGYREFMDELTPHVNRLKALHASRDPKHYTIADNQAAEAERTDILEIRRSRNFARRMPLNSDKGVGFRHPVSVVGNLDEGLAGLSDDDRHLRRVGVDRVLDEFFHDRGRAPDDLTRGDLVRDIRFKNMDLRVHSSLREFLNAESRPVQQRERSIETSDTVERIIRNQNVAVKIGVIDQGGKLSGR